MMDVEEDNEKELHVLRSAVMASMKAKLKQKEKASKTGSPLPENDIEYDPELAALRTVALMSKKEREEQARKAAILKQQQLYQFQPGHGAQSNLIMIKTVEMPKTNPPNSSNPANSQDPKKVQGKFSRFDDSNSEEEEEEEEPAKMSDSPSEVESSDNEEDGEGEGLETATQSDSNKENRDSSPREGTTSPSARSSRSSSADSSATSSSSSGSSLKSSSSSTASSSSSSEDEETKHPVVKVKKEPCTSGSEKKEKAEASSVTTKECPAEDIKKEGKHRKETKVFNDQGNSENKRKEYMSSRNGDRLRSGCDSNSRVSSSDRKITTDRYSKDSLRESRHKPLDSNRNRVDREQPRKDRRDYSVGDDRKSDQGDSRGERKYNGSSNSTRNRDVKSSSSTHRKDMDRHKPESNRVSSGKSTTREQVRTGGERHSGKREAESSNNNRGRSDHQRHQDRGSSRVENRDRSNNTKGKDSVHNNKKAISKEDKRYGTPCKGSKIGSEKRAARDSKNSRRVDKSKAKSGGVCISPGKLIHSSDSSFSESDSSGSKGAELSESDDSDSDDGGRSKHRKSERNTEDIERERRLRRIAAREKKEAVIQVKTEPIDRREERHRKDAGHRRERKEADRSRNRTEGSVERSQRRSNAGGHNRDVRDLGIKIKKEKSFKTENMENSVERSQRSYSGSKYASGGLGIKIKEEKDVKRGHDRNSSELRENSTKDQGNRSSRVESISGSSSIKRDRLKPPPDLVGAKTTTMKMAVVDHKGRRDGKLMPSDHALSDAFEGEVKDSKKAELMKEIQRIDQKLAAKRSSGGSNDKESKPKEAEVIKPSPPKTNKMKRKEVPRHSGDEGTRAEKPKKVKRSTSPVVNVTFDEEPTGVDQGKPVPSKKSVHDRLGNIVKETSSKTLSKSNRRVISVDEEDVDLRNLLHRRKPNKPSDTVNDVNYKGPPPQKDSYKDMAGGRKVTVYGDSMFEVKAGPSKKRRTASPKMSGVVSVVMKPVAKEERRKSSTDGEREHRDSRTAVQEGTSSQKKILLERPPVDKDPSYESELDARIRQIQQKNAAILQRQRQIEEEKRKFSAK